MHSNMALPPLKTAQAVSCIYPKTVSFRLNDLLSALRTPNGPVDAVRNLTFHVDRETLTSSGIWLGKISHLAGADAPD